jgi:ABC-type transport system substrate-binding protein
MNFTSPVPWEAVEYYTGEGGRESFAEHPVGSGPYKLTRYQKHARIVLTRNERWYGVTHPEARAPGAAFPALPAELGPELTALGPEALARARAADGRPLPFIERIEYRMEKERIPAFNKFVQGYYDISGIATESCDKVVRQDGLSPEMRALGMQLSKSVVPAIYYIGFNMDDPVVGRAGGERARLLRQAMSRATDVEEYLRLFQNGRGVRAESLLPPGIFGYDPSYRNPTRVSDLAASRQLLVEAGLPGGVDPATGRPLRLTFDVPDTSPEGRLRYAFWVSQWRRLGLDVVLAATTYNKFQEKVRDGAYQLFQWGWVADYPDPENFLFLLTANMSRKASGGPNTANFVHAEYDALFARVRTRDSDPERTRLIGEMQRILEHERPWIELFHPEEYALVQGWLHHVQPAGLSIPTTKYHDLDPKARARLRREWNRPVLWPAFALLALLLVLIVPGVRTYLKERQ